MSLGASDIGVDRGAAVGVGERDTSAVGQYPFVAPAHQRDDGRKEIAALLREVILSATALPGVLVGTALEQPVVDELAQPRSSDGVGEAGATDELVKAVGTVERLSERQHGRAATAHVEGGRQRAALGGPAVAVGQSSGQRDLIHATNF